MRLTRRVARTAAVAALAAAAVAVPITAANAQPLLTNCEGLRTTIESEWRGAALAAAQGRWTDFNDDTTNAYNDTINYAKRRCH